MKMVDKQKFPQQITSAPYQRQSETSERALYMKYFAHYLLGLGFFLLTAAAARSNDITFPASPLSISTPAGKVDFTVEVAASDAQHEYGLMFRKSMPQNHGMIFTFIPPKHIDMWMKNTFIPLDMLFVDDKGIITRIERNAKPESTDIISSGGPVEAVIEINGGAADHFHINKGDRVIYSLFK